LTTVLKISNNVVCGDQRLRNVYAAHINAVYRLCLSRVAAHSASSLAVTRRCTRCR